MQPIVKNCAGIDVHKMMVMVAVRKEMPEGDIQVLTVNLANRKAEPFIVRSKPWVVNARHVKNVPGRKTDTLDSQWLAHLAHCGLVRPTDQSRTTTWRQGLRPEWESSG